MDTNIVRDITDLYFNQVIGDYVTEVSADLALKASKEAGKRAGVLAGLSGGDPKVEAKARKKRAQAERLYTKQAKKRTVNITPIKEDENVVDETSHLEIDMKKRREANEKAVEDMKKTAAYKSMAATAAKKFDEEFIDPEHGEAPSGRTPLQNVSDHPKASVRKKAVKGFRAQMEKEYGGKWKSRSNDPVKEALDPVGHEDADVDNDGKKNTKSDKYLLNRRKAIGKAISTHEAKEVKRWWDDDGDGKGYEEGEVSGKFKKKKKIKEGFSNWRQDLTEIVDLVEKDENDEKITEKKVNNKIKINPSVAETVENLGGTLIEMVEIDEVDYIVESVYDELFEEGYEEDDIEDAIEYALTEATVTFGHDTPTGEKKKGNLLKAVGRLARQKLSSKVRSAKKTAAGAVAKGARKVAKGALGVARKMEGGDTKPSSAHTRERKASTYRGAGAGQKERVSSGSYTPPTKKKAEKPADPWEGSATTPSKAKTKTKKAAAPKAKAPAAPKRKRKSKLDDLLASVRSESVIVDRARNAVADQRLDDAQRETQSSVNKLRKDNVNRASASIAASKAERSARAMHPKAGQTGAYRVEEAQLDEKTLTAAETKEKERIVKSMKDKEADFEKRYPGRGREVMYATATKMAKRIAEQAMELQPKVETKPETSQQSKKIQQQQDRMRQQEVQILQRKLQALRSAPKGTDPSITA